MTSDEARALMYQWTASPALRVHMECVATCMGAYAQKLQPEQRDRWIVCGLLHDIDYEKHPTPAEHPFVAVEHLRSRGDVDEAARHLNRGRRRESQVRRRLHQESVTRPPAARAGSARALRPACV